MCTSRMFIGGMFRGATRLSPGTQQRAAEDYVRVDEYCMSIIYINAYYYFFIAC